MDEIYQTVNEAVQNKGLLYMSYATATLALVYSIKSSIHGYKFYKGLEKMEGTVETAIGRLEKLVERDTS